MNKLTRTACAIALATCLSGAGAGSTLAAGYSTFYTDLYPSQCAWKGVAKTYYESGSSNSEVHVRGRWYLDPNNNGGFYQQYGPDEDHQYGSGAKEARVAHNQPSGGQHRVEGRHWGSPWGSASYLTQATAGQYFC